MKSEKKEEKISLGRFIFQKRKERGLSLEKISSLSGLEKNILEELEKDNWTNLPPDIYVRGYLLKLADTLGVDGETLWSLYKQEKRNLRENKFRDHLPCLKEKKGKRATFFHILLISLFFVLIAIFSLWQIKKFIKPPEIQLSYPQNDVIVSSDRIQIKGKTNASILLINKQKIPLGEDGSFSFYLPLLEGINIIEIEGLNPFGQKTILKRKVIYSKSEIKNDKELF